MKAVTVAEQGAAPALQEIEETREPDAGEVLVRVQASSVNQLDGGIVAGMLADMLPHEYPITLGRDFVGVVEQVGDGVSSVAVGDEVFGEVPAMVPPVHDGAWTERIVVSDQVLAKKPEGVDIAQAGAAPLAALTATGGVLLLGVGLRLLALKAVAVGDLLPALVVAPLLTGLVDALR